MVRPDTRPEPRWTGPLPLWARPGPAGLRIEEGEERAVRPAILRFDHDDFMTDYLATVATDPRRLAALVARPETWREPMERPEPPAAPRSTGIGRLIERTRRKTAELRARRQRRKEVAIPRRSVPAPMSRPAPMAGRLKLYQAGHGRHYLVCASLVEQAPGLPDLRPGRRDGEQVACVVRRLLPPVDAPDAAIGRWREYAFVGEGEGARWVELGRHDSEAPLRLAGGEAEQPLFPTSYGGDCAAGRRLLAAVIPVNRREQWLGAPVEGRSEVDGQGGSVARERLRAEVIAPWLALLEQARLEGRGDTLSSVESAGDSGRADRHAEARDILQSGSWYVLLDLARFLERELPRVWRALEGEAVSLSPRELRLVTLLQQVRPDLGDVAARLFQAGYGEQALSPSLADSLMWTPHAGPELERVETPFSRIPRSSGSSHDEKDGTEGWPDFLFPLADPEVEAPLSHPLAGEGYEGQIELVEEIGQRIEALLPPDPAGAGRPPAAVVGEAGLFVVRCLFRRPACGARGREVVSAATEPFEVAAFFDPDAPARPVRIPMPVDVSPAGLRKYRKNVGFVLSDMLCGKVRRTRGMSFADLVLSVLPWPLRRKLPEGDETPCRDDGRAMGMLLSFSLPIVTLCAMILMMVMVALLDRLFRWFPFLMTWIPIPGLKARRGG